MRIIFWYTKVFKLIILWSLHIVTSWHWELQIRHNCFSSIFDLGISLFGCLCGNLPVCSIIKQYFEDGLAWCLKPFGIRFWRHFIHLSLSVSIIVVILSDVFSTVLSKMVNFLTLLSSSEQKCSMSRSNLISVFA